MKLINTIAGLLVFLFLEFQILPQEWQCAGSTESAEPMYIGSATHRVVLIYLDFQDGRMPNGSIPETEEDLLQVSNLDAMCFLGYNAQPLDEGITWVKKVRKYTYINCFNRIFSENAYLGNAHPDFFSHGQWGLPPASGSVWPDNLIPGDSAKGFGSVREYFKEASYGKLILEPETVRINEPYPYNKGIVNNITGPPGYQGTRFIIPVLLSGLKSSYDLNNQGGLSG